MPCKIDSQNFINNEYAWLNIEHILVLATKVVYILAQNCHNRSRTDDDVKRGAIFIQGYQTFSIFVCNFVSTTLGINDKDAQVCLYKNIR